MSERKLLDSKSIVAFGIGAGAVYFLTKSEADPSIVICPYGDRSKKPITLDWTMVGWTYDDWLEAMTGSGNEFDADSYPYVLAEPHGLTPVPSEGANRIWAAPSYSGTVNQYLKQGPYNLGWHGNWLVASPELKEYFEKMVSAWNHGYVFPDEETFVHNLFHLYVFGMGTNRLGQGLMVIDPWPLPRK